MKVLLAQINTTVGAFDGNKRRILQALDRGRAEEADLVVLPELTIPGYPPKDLLNRPWFIDENLARLDQVAAATTGLSAIVGYVERVEAAHGHGLRNAAAFCRDGRIVSRHHKTLIPTYDVFDEGRYFDPADSRQVAPMDDIALGVTICEDCWNDRLYWTQRRYDVDPVEELVTRGADVLINISASPYNLGKMQVRHGMFAAMARRHGKPLVHVNLVGGADSLLFDGASAVFGPDGQVVARAAAFQEDLLMVDLDLSQPSRIEPLPEGETAELLSALVMGTADYTRKCRFSKVLVGLSGGIDSALTAVIAAEALGPENVIGVSMPSRYSSQHSRDDAADLARNLGIAYRQIPIEPAFATLLDMLTPAFEGFEPDITEENIQARIRGLVLMALSNKYGAMVVTTGNKSEYAVGYATLYGDMCGGLAVLLDVPKTLVYALSRWINRDREVIPWSTIEKPPSAELRPDQKDTDSLPPYDVLDPILRAYVEDHLAVDAIVERVGADRATVERVLRMIDRSEYKRQQAAPGLRVTTKAFGYGRRMPIAAYDL